MAKGNALAQMMNCKEKWKGDIQLDAIDDALELIIDEIDTAQRRVFQHLDLTLSELLERLLRDEKRRLGTLSKSRKASANPTQ